MKKTVSRILVMLLAVALVATCLPMTAFAAYENTHVNTGDMAEDIVAVAKTQLGYHEGSLAGTTSGTNNYTKYGVWYGDYIGDSSFDYGQWCAMFVSWCANQAGIPNSIVYYHAYCPYGVTWFKNQGLWKYSAYQGGSYVPKRGDIIYFKNSQGIAGHIGIVDYVSGSTVYTLEGNTSSATYDPNGNVATNKSYSLSSSYILGYGLPNYTTGTGTSAQKLGTYRITASSLNVRSGAGTSYGIVGTLATNELVVVSELSGSWGKVTLSDGTVGWCSVGDYGDYIGVDALNTELAAVWGAENLTMTTNANGSVTFTNKSATDAIAVDMPLANAIGNKTTPYLNISVSRHSGGWYFGLTKTGSGYFMMRECNSGDELVNATSATYMQTDEQLQINIGEWWAPENKAQIDDVRLYLNAGSSVTVNYCYFADASGVVTSTAYNMRKGGTGVAPDDTQPDTDPVVPVLPDPTNLMLPDTLYIPDRTKTGSYTYQNGKLTVVSGDAGGYDVAMDVNLSFTPEELHRWLISVESNVRFDIELLVTTLDGERTFSLRDDFYNEFTATPDGDYIPAFTGSAGLGFLGCYTWNNVLPADGVSVVKTVTYRLGGQGTLVVNACQLAPNDELKIYTDSVVKSDATPDGPVVPPVIDKVMGDVSGDGVVNTVDARMLLVSLLGSSSLTSEQEAVADYNGSGDVTTVDVREMLRDVL